MTAAESGRRGGLKTLETRGKEYMALIGAKGGQNRGKNKRRKRSAVEPREMPAANAPVVQPPSQPFAAPGTSIREAALKLAAALTERLP